MLETLLGFITDLVGTLSAEVPDVPDLPVDPIDPVDPVDPVLPDAL